MDKHIIKPIQRMSLRDEVYHTLRRSIITLELQPEERLSDKDLAEKFGISRTPVREALKKLEDEGLVGSLPGSSTFVAPLHVKEAEHAFTVVAVLHALAARLAAPLLEPADIQALEECNASLQHAIERGNAIQAVEADTSFHKVFLDVAANPEIILALERSIPKIQRLEISQFNTLNGLQSVEQHLQIMDACRLKEYDRVARLVEDNWLSLGKLLTEPSELR